MKSAAVVLSLAGAVLAGGVTESISPSGSYPSGCSKDYDGNFELTVETVETANSKRDLSVKIKRSSECGNDGILLVSLSGGVLTDSKGRTGYIASNYQFQFDDPPQDGAIYTAGFSVCDNDTLALGSTTTWWQCKSGDFWNLYDRNWAAQCDEIELGTISCASDAAVSEGSDGQVVGTSQITTTVVQTIGDGQVQAVTTTVPQLLCQITDGQAQVRTTACESITTTSTVATTTPVPISQYSDGQIQVTTPATGAATATATPATATTTAPGGATTGSVVATTVVGSSSSAASAYSNSTLVTASGTVTSGSSESSTPASSSPASSSSIVASDARLIGASSFAVAVVGLLTAFIAL